MFRIVVIIVVILSGCGDHFTPSYGETGDLNPPKILHLTPSSGEIIALNRSIEIVFSPNLSYSSLFGRIKCVSGADQPSFYLGYYPEGEQIKIVLTPYQRYLPEVTYYCTIDRGIRSVDNISSTEAYQFQFTTGSWFEYGDLDQVLFSELISFFDRRCVHCHHEYNGDDTLYNYLIFEQVNGIPLIVPEKPEESYLFQKIGGVGRFKGEMMPPGEELSLEELMIPGGWIEQGGVNADR